MNDQEYNQVSQDTGDDNIDNPPHYQDILTETAQPQRQKRSIEMPDLESCGQVFKGNATCKLVSALLVVALGVTIACVVDSYHKINEGNVGIYYRHGALQDRVTDPGVHFLQPFIEDYVEVKVRPDTFTMEDVISVTKDGVENRFKEITAITRIRKDKIVAMTRKYGPEFKRVLVFDRIVEELRIFCANHTIDEVYKTKFLAIVEQVRERVKTSIKRLGDEGIEILNLVIPKPVIPSDIAENYKQVKVQWTKQLVAEQEKLTKEKLKETEEMEATADEERKKKVLEIRNEAKILEKEGEQKVSKINNAIRQEAERTEAEIQKFKTETEAAANKLLLTKEYVQLNLAKALANNTKMYFSGDDSVVGSIFTKIFKN